MTTLRERAQAALIEFEEKCKQAREEQEERNRQFAAKTLRDRLQGIGIDAEPTTGVIAIDGITFQLSKVRRPYSGYDTYLVVSGLCPGCGEVIESHPITQLHQVGAWLNGGHRPAHTCGQADPPAPEPEPQSLGDQLTDLLIQIIDSRMPYGG